MEKIQKKIYICEKLGAPYFQNVVFLLEKWKYCALSKLPYIFKYYDKLCDYKKSKELKKVHSVYTKKQIIRKYRNRKGLIRGQFYKKQNVNYHFNEICATDFVEYLEWNKKIHKDGMEMNAVLIPFFTLCTFSGLPFSGLLLTFEVASLFINFQCVNLQNYNIYRFQQKKEKLQTIQQKKQERFKQNYNGAIEAISQSLEETNNLPSIDDLLSCVKTPSQVEQLRKWQRDLLKSQSTHSEFSAKKMEKKY